MGSIRAMNSFLPLGCKPRIMENHLAEDLKTENNNLGLDLKDLLQRYEEAGDVVSSLQTELDETKQSNENLNAQVKGLLSRDFKKEDQILELEETVADLQRQRAELDLELKSSHLDREELNSQHEVEVNKLLDEKEQLASQLQDSIIQRRGYIEIIQECSEAATASDHLIGQLTQHIKELKEDLISVTGQNEELQIDSYRMKIEKDQLTSDLEDQQLFLEGANLRYSVLLASNKLNDQQFTELEKDDEELQESLQIAENSRLDSAKKVKDLTQQNKDLLISFERLQRENEELSAEISDQEVQFLEDNLRLAVMHTAAKPLEKQITEIQNERNELRQKLHASEKERLDLLFDMNNMSKSLDIYRKEAGDAERRELKFFEELEKSCQEWQDVEEELDLAKLEIQQSRETDLDYDDLSQEFERSRQECEDVILDMDELSKSLDMYRKEAGDSERREMKFFEELEKSCQEWQDAEEELDLAKQEIQLSRETVLDYDDLSQELEMSRQECKEMEERLSLLKELVGLLDIKVVTSETNEKKMADELQTMKASLAAASFQFGLLNDVGESVTVFSLCRVFKEMKQNCKSMQLEVTDLKKTKATFQEMLMVVDPYQGSGDWGEENNDGRTKIIFELKETIEDLRFQTNNQDILIRKLKYNLSEFHRNHLKRNDSMYEGMTYYHRALVHDLGIKADLKILNPDDLSYLAEACNDDDLIGQGAFGEVFLRVYQDETVAIKVPYISDIVDDDDDEKRISSNHARTTMEAVVHLALAELKYFPKCLGIIDFEDAPSLVLEFIGDKKTGAVYSLDQAIKFQIPALSRTNWFDIIMDMVQGVKVMHDKGLLHNNLKPDSILLQWDYDEKRWQAFIIDMGEVCTQTIPLNHHHLPKEEIEGYKDGTLFQHLAPECILESHPMSVQTDIYSVGKLLSQIEMVMKSETGRELAADMTNVKPRLRPSWRHIEKAIREMKTTRQLA